MGWNSEIYEGAIGMTHRIKSVNVLPDYCLRVHFTEGVTKEYDVKPLMNEKSIFQALHDNCIFNGAEVIDSGDRIIWNDDVGISSGEIFDKGKLVETSFDGLMAFTDATEMWGLNESTLRKAIAYGKLVRGIDACKYGKQWVVSTEAMRREYGEPHQNRYNNTLVRFITDGAAESRYNADHWFRYMRKCFSGDEILINQDEIQAILDSGKLTMFQIVTFKRAMEPGTATNRYVINLNRRTDTPMYRELMRRKGLESLLKDKGINEEDEAIRLEKLGEAYGMEWLEKYYTDNEFELRGINNDC